MVFLKASDDAGHIVTPVPAGRAKLTGESNRGGLGHGNAMEPHRPFGITIVAASGRNDDVAVNRQGEHKAIVIVDVLTHQINPAGRRHDQRRFVAELGTKGLPDLGLHRWQHRSRSKKTGCVGQENLFSPIWQAKNWVALAAKMMAGRFRW